MHSHVSTKFGRSDAVAAAPAIAASSAWAKDARPVVRERPREDSTWVNVLALAVSAGSVPVGMLAFVAPVMALSAVVFGFVGVRAARRGTARFAPMGYAAIAIGVIALGGMVWLFASSASTFHLHPTLG